MEGNSVKPGDELLDRSSFGGQIGEDYFAARVAQERPQHRQRVRRFGRAEHFFAFLTAALPGEGNAVDQRRVDEQSLSAKHQDQRTPVRRTTRCATDRWPDLRVDRAL